MQYKCVSDGSYYWTDAPNFDGSQGDTLAIAISTEALEKRCERGTRWQLGQVHGVISTGAIHAVSAHRGLARGMLVRDDHDAHKDKIALVLNPQHDAKLAGDRFSPQIEKFDAPQNQVFVIYLSPNERRAGFPEVDYWIEHWTWVDADTEDPRQPFGFSKRYDEPCIWDAQ